MDAQLLHLDGVAAAAQLDEICDVYADAYEVGPGVKVDAFRMRAVAAVDVPGFDLVTVDVAGETVGFVFGYSLQTAAWWEGLDPEPPAEFTVEDGSRTVVLSEIEVRKVHQRHGLGRRLESEFLSGRHEDRATLATGGDAPSQHVYPRWGWQRAGTVPGNPDAYFSSYVLFVKTLQHGTGS